MPTLAVLLRTWSVGMRQQGLTLVLCGGAGTDLAALIIAVMYAGAGYKPACASVWPRAVAVPYLATMLQVTCHPRRPATSPNELKDTGSVQSGWH